MSSLELDGGAPSRPKPRGVSRLLDAAFGFFVWALHFLAIYIAAAMACVLGLGAASDGTRAAFLSALAVLTLVAIAAVVFHAVRRYRQQRDVPDQRFRMSVTIGCDAIATVAIAWQFFPLLLVPLCA